MTLRHAVLAAVLVLAGCVAPVQRPGEPGRAPAPGQPAPGGGPGTGTVTRPAEGPAAPPQRKFRSDVDYPRTAEAVSGPAVMSLLGQAREARTGGRPDQAVALLETALQIEKRNPFVWSSLAQAHLANRAPEDAEIVAHRSNSFANGNPYVEVENWRVIARARQARGDAAGVQAAQERLAELEPLLDD